MIIEDITSKANRDMPFGRARSKLNFYRQYSIRPDICADLAAVRFDRRIFLTLEIIYRVRVLHGLVKGQFEA